MCSRPWWRFVPYHRGEPVDAVILQADHPEYLDLTPTDLPGATVIIDGRGVLKRQNFPGTAFFRIGDGE